LVSIDVLELKPKRKKWLALEDDFRTLDWSQIAKELPAFSERCAFPETKALPNPKSQS
jgi:hypothetical protein